MYFELKRKRAVCYQTGTLLHRDAADPTATDAARSVATSQPRPRFDDTPTPQKRSWPTSPRASLKVPRLPAAIRFSDGRWGDQTVSLGYYVGAAGTLSRRCRKAAGSSWTVRNNCTVPLSCSRKVQP